MNLLVTVFQGLASGLRLVEKKILARLKVLDRISRAEAPERETKVNVAIKQLSNCLPTGENLIDLRSKSKSFFVSYLVRFNDLKGVRIFL